MKRHRMRLEALENLIRELPLEDLPAVRHALDERVRELTAPPEAAEGDERRLERRFAVRLIGTARPLMSPGGVREKSYPVSIVNLSRNGLRFLLEANVPLYPLVEVSFTGPTGRIRTVRVKLVRIRMLPAGSPTDPVRRWEIAARALDDQELAEAQHRQRQLAGVAQQLRATAELPIVLFGGRGDLQRRYERLLTDKGHPVTCVSERAALLDALPVDPAPAAVVYAEGEQTLLHRPLVQQIRNERPRVAQLAVVHTAQDREATLATGVDECIHAVNADELLVLYVQRAIRAHLAPVAAPVQTVAPHVLVNVADNLALAELGMNCHRDNFPVTFSYDMNGMLALLRCTAMGAVVLDDRAAGARDWAALDELRREFPQLPIVVAVQDLALGPVAVRHGATDYLPLPATKNDLTAVVASARRVTEFEAAQAGQEDPAAA